MFLLPFGLLGTSGFDADGVLAIARNLALVALGNVLGAVGVALAYWAAYRPTSRGTV